MTPDPSPEAGFVWIPKAAEIAKTAGAKLREFFAQGVATEYKGDVDLVTGEVNRLGEWMDPVSDETVQRALESLYMETKDRRFERLTRVGHPRAAS